MALDILIRFWKELVIAVLVVIIGLLYNFWRNEIAEHQETKMQLEIATETIKLHEANNKLTEEINHDYENNISRLNADINRLRQRPAKCVPITKPSVISLADRSGRGHGEENGISSGWLYEYAFEAEQIRIERNSCKDFVSAIYDSRK